MNSLKKKFCKFTVSYEKIAMVSGGSDPTLDEHPEPRWVCHYESKHHAQQYQIAKNGALAMELKRSLETLDFQVSCRCLC